MAATAQARMGLRARMETARFFVAFAVLLMTAPPLPACTVANRDAHRSIFSIPIFPGWLFPARQSADSPQSSANSPQDTGESSSKHTGHHIRVPVEDDNAEPAELTEAEQAIDRNNYPDAETILRKFVERQPANYVAWFDLGFVENALGKLTDSIAAYRKSVEAKPDVFESNLNLGLQLAKNGQPDAEKFLRQATQLTPTSHLEEGKYRAWIALAQTVEKAKPDEAL